MNLYDSCTNFYLLSYNKHIFYILFYLSYTTLYFSYTKIDFFKT